MGASEPKPKFTSSALFGRELRACVRLQKSAGRAAKDPHRNTLTLRNFPDLPEQRSDLLRYASTDVLTTRLGPSLPQVKPCTHLAIALGAPIRSRTHTRV